MIPWLRTKLDTITKEFLDGGGFGAVFEATYLAYLECYIAARNGDFHKMWHDFRADCVKLTPEGEEPRGHYHRTEGNRQALVDLLVAFRSRYEGPRKAKPEPTVKAQSDAPASSTEGEGLDLFDIIGGDE